MSCYHPRNPNRGSRGGAVDEVRARYSAFMHFYNRNGGIKNQEVDDIGILLAEIDRLKIVASQ